MTLAQIEHSSLLCKVCQTTAQESSWKAMSDHELSLEAAPRDRRRWSL